MDLGALLKAPTEDPDWVKKILLIGVMMLIPVAGALNLMGYQKACYKSRTAGDKNLPPADLSYIGDGWWVFVALVPIMIPIFVVYAMMIVGAIAFEGSAIGGIIMLFCSLLLLVVGLGMMVLSPAIYYRHFVHGDRWAALSIGPMINLVKTHSSPYIMLWVTLFVGNLIGQLGVMACYIGMFFTLPFAAAVAGYAIADFANETDRA